MENKIPTCKIEYEAWQMQCCGTPLAVGERATLTCIKLQRQTNFVGIEIDYSEEHHGCGANCQLSGKVSRLQAVFVDEYGPHDNGVVHNMEDPENKFAVIDTNYIDGSEQPECYGNRDGFDAWCYIVTLEDAVESEYTEPFNSM